MAFIKGSEKPFKSLKKKPLPGLKKKKKIVLKNLYNQRLFVKLRKHIFYLHINICK